MAEFYQFKIAKWNTSTDDMSLEQEAALLRVVNAIRLYDRPITMNLRVLAGLWRCNERKAKRLLSELIETGEITVEDGLIVNQRAVEDASTYSELRVERQLAGRQGGIESGKSRAKALKNNNPSEALGSTIKKRKEKKEYIGGDDAGARDPDPPPEIQNQPTDREQILTAIGADPISGLIGLNGKQIGRMADMQEARRWRDDLGLNLNEVLSVIDDVMSRKTDGPPGTFSYFTAAMQRHAGEKAKPKLTPIEGGQSERANPGDHRNRNPHTAAGRAHQNLVAAFAGTIPDER